MPKAELTEKQMERFQKCYSIYRKKVSRGQAEITWQKWNPDDKLTEEIYQAIIAQNRAGEKYCVRRYLRNFSTWLNAMGWKDEIPSNMESTKATQGEITCIQCHNKVFRKFTLCKVCEDKYTAKAKAMADQFCKELGLENREAMRKWARAMLKQKYSRMIRHD